MSDNAKQTCRVTLDMNRVSEDKVAENLNQSSFIKKLPSGLLHSALLFSAMLVLNGCLHKAPEPLDEADIQALLSEEITLPERWGDGDILDEVVWQNVSTGIVQESGFYAGISDIGNEQLIGYIDQALQHNYDLQASASRLLSVFEDIDIATSALIPEINADLSGTRFQQDNDGTTQYIRNHQANLTLSWELDVWGKLQDARNVARLSAMEQTLLYASARNSLMVNVARAWTNYFFTFEIYQLAQRQLQSLETTLEIVEANYRVGLREASDVYLTRSNVETQRLAVEQAREEVELAAQSFYVLVGEYPASSIEAERAIGTRPELSPLDTVLPSELLLRRPDILAAHYQYLSALKNVSAREKEQYPSFTLNSSIGTEDNLLKRLVKVDDALWSVMGGVTQPVFNADRIDSNIRKAEFEAEAARADYFSTMLNAFAEVEGALTSTLSLGKQAEINEKALEFATYSLQQSRELYNQGLEDVVQILSAERQLFDTEINRISIINQQIQNRLSLYLALGGDFYNNADWLKNFSRVIFEQRDTKAAAIPLSVNTDSPQG